MAILFDNAASEYLEVNSAPVTAAPFSISAWFYHDEAQQGTILSLPDKDVANHYFDFYVLSTHVVRFSAAGGGAEAIAATTATGTINTWHHAAGVAASATSRSVYLDGANKVTNTTSVTPSGVDRISLGRWGASTPTDYFSGRLAEWGVWNVALTDAEIAILGLGFSPLMVRPESLVFYLPGFALGGSGSQEDWISSRAMTETNTPATASHPPAIIHPVYLNTLTGLTSISLTGAAPLMLSGLEISAVVHDERVRLTARSRDRILQVSQRDRTLTVSPRDRILSVEDRDD